MTDEVIDRRLLFLQILWDTLVLLPRTVVDANVRCAQLVRIFQEEVDPLLLCCITDQTERALLRARLLPAAVKGAFLMQNYARMVEKPPAADIGIMAGAFTRVYDDLIDASQDETIIERLLFLFQGDIFGAISDQERLFVAFYRWIENRLPRSSFPVCYEALPDLHCCQQQSRQQTTGFLSEDDLYSVTLRKGAKGTLVLCGIIQGNMSGLEKALIEEMGGCFQHIDDYEDVGDDRRRGVNTLATKGHLSLKLLAERLLNLAANLQSYYGRKNSRAFIAGLYYWLSLAQISHLLANLGLRGRRESRGRKSSNHLLPIQLLFYR